MAQRPAFDMTKLSSADKIILGGSGIFFVWSVLPIWYKFSGNGWFGVTTICGVAALLQLLGMWSEMSGGARRVRGLDLVLAGLALLFVLIGAGDKPSGVEVAWGLWVALAWALIWGYGAYMKMQEAGAAPPAEGGFTA
jgi:hypothetical protein